MEERIVKPKNQRVKRFLEDRAPKLIENTKKAVFIRGGNTSDVISQALKDFYLLKKPDAVLFRKKNILRPFEDVASIEFFSDRNDTSLFMFGSHNKKRPHNLVIGRLFDHHVLDMVELGINSFKAIHDFTTSKCVLGSKPCFVFSGDAFETDQDYIRLKNLFIDFFRGPDVTKVRLAGLDHVMSFSAVDGKIYLRTYQIQLKKSGSRTPRVELEEMGPSLDLVMRRTKLASPELIKQACRQPKATKPKTVKNVSYDTFGTKLGRVHMKRQNLAKLGTFKAKGLKRTHKEKDDSRTFKKSKVEVE
ncbi:hypothetical protein EMCRGX_G034818 [Ephydatia muelleri]